MFHEWFSVSFIDADRGDSHASIHLNITAETRIKAFALYPHTQMCVCANTSVPTFCIQAHCSAYQNVTNL